MWPTLLWSPWCSGRIWRSKPISGCTPPGAATAAFCHGFTGLRRHLDEILYAAAVSHILLRSETDSDRGSLRKEPRRPSETIIAIAAGPRARIRFAPAVRWYGA